MRRFLAKVRLLIGLLSGTSGKVPVSPFPTRCSVDRFDENIHAGIEPWKPCPVTVLVLIPSRNRLLIPDVQMLVGRVPEI